MSTVLQLQAKQDHLEKIAASRDPVKAVAEFVWNALDADAETVRLRFLRNALGGLEAVIIEDDGTGISEVRAKSSFRDLGDSWKRNVGRTPLGKRAIHGKEGRGRLRFFSLSDTATWRSTYRAEGGGTKEIELTVHAGSLASTEISDPIASEESFTGTAVTLTSLKPSLEWLSSDLARHEFTSLFAPYLLQYPSIEIFYDGKKIDTAETISVDEDIPQPTLVCPTSRKISDLRLKVIEWKNGEGGRKINLGKDNGVVLGSVPANVTAPEFNFSAYAYSSFFQEMADEGLLELGELNDEDYLFVLKHIRSELTDYFRRRQADKAGSLIDELKRTGAYPYEGEPATEVETREREVFDIATYTVASYSRDFKKAESSMQRLALTLMREALRQNPDSLTNILNAVVKLPKYRQDEFSSLLDHTELGNIIASSKLISDRVVTLAVLKGIVFDDKHKRSVKERGELDVLIRDNTWIFGEGFHITVPEQGLTQVMRRVAQDLGTGHKPKGVRKPDGKSGRIDQMLGRSVPHPDPNKREYMLIELKRPSITLSRKELGQVEDYLMALKDQPDFRNTDTTWTLFLVGGEYDDFVKTKITQSDRPAGMYYQGINSKIWVKNWAEIIRECEGRLKFIQDQLDIIVAQDEIERRITELKAAVLKTDREQSVAGKPAP